MRSVIVALLLAAAAAAQGMGPASRVDGWKSKHNQKRLRFTWELPPPYKPTKLPDGTEEPPKAPWPFLVYVFQNPSKGSDKLQNKVFDDTRFVLACHAVKPIKLKPHKAIEIPYLARVQGIQDPTLIVVNRDFEVLGVIKSAKDFTDKKVLQLMGRAAKETYAVKLGAYVVNYIKLLQVEEKIWKQEEKTEALRAKAVKAIGKGDKAKGAKYDREADEIEATLAPLRDDLADREIALQDSLVLVDTGPKEELPTTVGTGKKKRKLTPQELEAIQTFREFAREENPIVRAAAVEDLGGIDSPVMVEVILKAANDVDPRVVDAAGKALGRMKSEESVEAMHAGLTGGNAKARTAALLGFSHIARPYPPAVPAIAGMLRGGSDEIRRAAIKALENQKDPAAAGALIKALDDKLSGLRVMAAHALGEIKAKAAAGPLAERLTASDWSLRKASADALGKIRVKESIEPLLQSFEKEKGLMEEVLYKALVAITGQDFRYNAQNWRRWWDRWGHAFEVPTEAELAIMKKKAEEALKGYYNPNKKKYHKIETLSRKLVFVIDISASMKNKIVIPPYAPDEVKEEFPDRRKIEIAKKELIDLLATLEPNVYFNIITFAGRVKPWQDGLVSASMRTAAIKYVAKLKALEPPRGGKKKAGSGEEVKTNTYGALMAAFGLQDEAVPNWKARTRVDTIFMVTDGVPTTGKIVEVPKLVDAITDLNRTRGVIIHVVAFDKEEGKKLAKLATRNGGQCVIRGWTGERG
ncbi:MAG: HEAT repeat domain-containing protein [Planctomycetota bacterium]|jgi:HEAT repeat protein